MGQHRGAVYGETAAGELSAPATRSLVNALMIDIPNAVLALPDGGEFQQASSTAGITFVSVFLDARLSTTW